MFRACSFSTIPPRLSPHLEKADPNDACFYEFETAQWLYNEREQLACRHMKWDVDALIDRVCTVFDAEKITRLEKLSEGSYNRAFKFTFDNDKGAVLRLPCPLAGPASLITASEVATMEFAREVLNIPVPRVFDWSADSTKCGGIPYILMEPIPGIGLNQRGPVEREEGTALLDDTLKIEKAFEKVQFSQLGSLYFTEDVSADLQARPLFAENMELDSDVLRKAASRYRIGPLVDRQWYRGERATMAVDRGPWPDFVSYCLAGINLELAWLDHPASKSQPFRRTAMQSPRLHRSVLEMCAKVIPLILPDTKYMQPTLWHPDLNTANLLIAPSGKAHVLSLIDWQHAVIAPYAFQAAFPEAFIYEGDMTEFRVEPETNLTYLPDDLHERSAEVQMAIKVRYNQLMFQKIYQAFIVHFNRRRLEAINLPQSAALTLLPLRILRSWSDGVGPVTAALLSFRDKWESIVSVPGTPCPLDELTEGEIQEYRDASEQAMRFLHAVDRLNAELGVSGDGRVPISQYEHVQQERDRLKSAWDEERDGGPFPYQDGGYSFFLS
ncbi:hypothetical protein H0H92_008689 [Tricholoma furcatifolium]|nr:hypothetical protein H0H92_008689 [Tricholoma furcatifolium]